MVVVETVFTPPDGVFTFVETLFVPADSEVLEVNVAEQTLVTILVVLSVFETVSTSVSTGWKPEQYSVAIKVVETVTSRLARFSTADPGVLVGFVLLSTSVLNTVSKMVVATVLVANAVENVVVVLISDSETCDGTAFPMPSVVVVV